MTTETRAPWFHRPMVLLAALFYLAGTVDYLFLKLGLGFYMARFTEDQAAYFAALPLWANLLWAVAVWGGLFGVYLLWKRNRFSVHMLFVSFACLVALTVVLGIFTRPGLISIMGFLGFYVMIGTCALAFLIYLLARWERTEAYLG